MTGRQIAFDSFVLSADGSLLTRQGAPVSVSYRGLRLLSALLQRPGDVLSKTELMAAAWPDNVVEESNLTVQIAALRRLLGRGPEGNEWIATIPRVGYRFTGTVEDREAEPGEAARGPSPSIAVLPFANLGGEADQQYFADGLAEDIITRLGRLRWLFVSARNSSFIYRGRSVDARQVGEELGVRYILDGSVRSSGPRLRITAQLSDSATRGQVWARTYDVEKSDFLTLQDRIAESVIAAIEPRIHAAEQSRFVGGSVERLDAWGLVMRAMPYVWTWGASHEIEIAQSLLRRALEIDPDYPRANSLLSWTHAAQVQLGWVEARDGLDVALAMARRAIQRDSEDPWARLAAGYAHMVSRSFEAALAELHEAIDLNPSFAFAHMILASTYGYGGKPEDGLHHIVIADRLSPRDFAQAANFATAGMCHFVAGRYDEAVALELRAVELRPHFVAAWRTLTASAGMAGNLEIATRALARAKGLQPSLSLDWVERYHGIVRTEDRGRYIEGLRRAGLT